jgi:hypothetical protein
MMKLATTRRLGAVITAGTSGFAGSTTNRRRRASRTRCPLPIRAAHRQRTSRSAGQLPLGRKNPVPSLPVGGADRPLRQHHDPDRALTAADLQPLRRGLLRLPEGEIPGRLDDDAAAKRIDGLRRGGAVRSLAAHPRPPDRPSWPPSKQATSTLLADASAGSRPPHDRPRVHQKAIASRHLPGGHRRPGDAN